MKELVLMDMDEVRKLKGWDKLNALRKREEWLNRQRKQDKLEGYSEFNKKKKFMKRISSRSGINIQSISLFNYDDCYVRIDWWVTRKTEVKEYIELAAKRRFLK